METLSSPNTKSELAVLSARPAFRSASDIALRQWFVKFAELKREDVPDYYIDLWCSALSDLEPEWIEFGCRAYFQSMKFLPMPGDIRELVEAEKTSRACSALFTHFDPERAEKIRSAIDESRRTHRDVDEIMREWDARP